MTWMPTVSDGGRIALARFMWVAHLWEVLLDPATGGAAGPARRLTDEDAPKFGFSLSRDGDRLAYSSYFFVQGAERVEVRLQDRTTGEETVAVSVGGGRSGSLRPRLSPDGRVLTWRRRVEGKLTTFVAPTGESSGRPLCEACGIDSFFSDGEHVLVDRGRTLTRMNVDRGEESVLLEVEDRVLLDADLSWDDEALAVVTGGPEGDLAIHVVPVRDAPVPPEEWVRVAGGDFLDAPRWSPDGRLLYFLSDRDDYLCVWAQALDPKTHQPVGDPIPIAHAHDSEQKLLSSMRSMWSLAVGQDRLVYNAARSSGNVYTALLPEP
jgi:Tol biopolymer transport system component